MKRPKSLTTKLEICDQELKLYIFELEKINLNLHKKIAKLQAQNVSLDNKIKVLRNQNFMPKPDININFTPSDNHK